MINWIELFQVSSQRIRKQVLKTFGSDDADTEFGIGAGGDLMKQIDLVAENALIDVVQNLGASCTLISEETGFRTIGPDPSDFYITLDPVDGSTNATRGLPFIATSIAGSNTPSLIDVNVALVADLYHNIVYTAQKNEGALKNGERITPSTISSVTEAIVGVDFKGKKIKELIKSLTPLLEKIGHIRHLGANALEICYVADGTIDAFIDYAGKLRVTDTAAAYLILREAGGLMVTPEGDEIKAKLTPTQRFAFIAAANPMIYHDITDQLIPN